MRCRICEVTLETGESECFICGWSGEHDCHEEWDEGAGCPVCLSSRERLFSLIKSKD